MPKIRNAHHIQITLDGGRAEISQAEYELSSDEWHRRRTHAFERLRKFGWVPEELLNLVERFEERTRVELFAFRPGKELSLRFGMRVAKEEADKTDRFDEMVTVGTRLSSDDLDDQKMNASEALAFLLRIELRSLKHDERLRRAAPVRALKHLPRSLIAEIAMDLLESCETWDYSPGPFLNSLLRELLNLDQDRQGMSREADRRDQAAVIIAQAPTITTRELARALHVNASTVSRWRRSQQFRKMVESWRKAFERGGGWKQIPVFAKKGPVKGAPLTVP